MFMNFDYDSKELSVYRNNDYVTLEIDLEDKTIEEISKYAEGIANNPKTNWSSMDDLEES